MNLYYRNVYQDVPGFRRGLHYGRIEKRRQQLPRTRNRDWTHVGVETVAAEPGAWYVIVFFDPVKP